MNGLDYMTTFELNIWSVGLLKEWLKDAENDDDIIVANVEGDMVLEFNLGMVKQEDFLSMLTTPEDDGE